MNEFHVVLPTLHDSELDILIATGNSYLETSTHNNNNKFNNNNDNDKCAICMQYSLRQATS